VLGAAVAIHSIQSEAISRGARMLRTAFGPAIARFLEDPVIIEVMLNPDGRLWIDRLSNGLANTGECPHLTESAWFDWSHTASVPRSMRLARTSRPSCQRRASASKERDTMVNTVASGLGWQ
jgi:hypothetical protein